jgi:hypothetical protein
MLLMIKDDDETETIDDRRVSDESRSIPVRHNVYGTDYLLP